MPRSTKQFLFPDINVWVALTSDAHVHHTAARRWFDALGPGARLFFCRFTQLGLLRLLTTEVVMGDDVLSQEQAWHAYDRWLDDDRIGFLGESDELESVFRTMTRSRQAAPKDWADSYLAAFAQSGQLALVTFDRAFQDKADRLILLSG